MEVARCTIIQVLFFLVLHRDVRGAVLTLKFTRCRTISIFGRLLPTHTHSHPTQPKPTAGGIFENALIKHLFWETHLSLSMNLEVHRTP